MNFAAKDPALAIECIEAIAFGQEMFERARAGEKLRTNGTIAPQQRSGSCARMTSLAGIFDPAIAFLAAHPRAEVGQVKPIACESDRLTRANGRKAGRAIFVS